MSIANVKRVLDQADSVDWREGLAAYGNYNRMMQALADYYGYSLHSVAAVFSALSPNNDYMKNLRSAVTLLKGYRAGVPVEQLTTTSYRACKLRAWRVLQGEDFLTFTKGLKTRNFYECIVNPEHPTAITIDGHMVNIFKNEHRSMLEVTWRKFNYDVLACEYRRVAFSEFVLPSQLQAILWFTWKRINRIVYDGNYRLFDSGDEWRMRLEPGDIKPYESNGRREKESVSDARRITRAKAGSDFSSRAGTTACLSLYQGDSE